MSDNAHGQHDANTTTSICDTRSGGDDNRSAEQEACQDQFRIAIKQALAGRALNESASISQQTDQQDPGLQGHGVDAPLRFGPVRANAASGYQQRSDPSRLPQTPPAKSKQPAARDDESTGDGCMNSKAPSHPPVTHRPTAQFAGEFATVPPIVHQPSSTSHLDSFEYHSATYPTVGSGKLVDMQKKKLQKQAAKKNQLDKQAATHSQRTDEQLAQSEQTATQTKAQQGLLSRKDETQKKRQEGFKKTVKDDIFKNDIKGKQEELMRQQLHQQTQQHTMMQYQQPQLMINQPYNQMIHPQSMQQCYSGQSFAPHCYPPQQYPMQQNMMYNVVAYPQPQYPPPQYPHQYHAQPMMNNIMSFTQPNQLSSLTSSIPVSSPALTPKEGAKSEHKKKDKKKKKKKKVVKIINSDAKYDKENKNKQDESDLTVPPLPPPSVSITSPSFEMECDTFANEPVKNPMMIDKAADPGGHNATAFHDEREEALSTNEASYPLHHIAKHPQVSTHPSLVSTQAELINNTTTGDPPALTASVTKNESDDSPDSWVDEVAEQDVTDQRALSTDAANAAVHVKCAKDGDEDNCIKFKDSTDDQDSFRDSTFTRETVIDDANLNQVTPESEATSITYPTKNANDSSADGSAVLHHSRKDNFSPYKHLHLDTSSFEKDEHCRSTMLQGVQHHPSKDCTVRSQSDLTSTISIKSLNGVISDDDEVATLKSPPNCISSDMTALQDLSSHPAGTYPTDEANHTSTEGDDEKEESSKTKSSNPTPRRGSRKEPFETKVESDHVPSPCTGLRLELQKEKEIQNEHSELKSYADNREGCDSQMCSLRASTLSTSNLSENFQDELFSRVSRNVGTVSERVRDKLPVDSDTTKDIIGKLNRAITKTNLLCPSSEDIVDGEDDDLSWECMLMQLEAYKQRFGDLSVPSPQKNEENTTQSGWYHIYVWVKNQREKYSEGVLLPERSQKLLNLGLDLNPKSKHSVPTAHSRRRTSKRKKKEIKRTTKKQQKISGLKEFAGSTKLQLCQENKLPQIQSQPSNDATVSRSMHVGHNFMATNLQQPTQNPYQQSHCPSQVNTSHQSLHQMQTSYQQFNPAAQGQYPIIASWHYQPVMNTLQPQMCQVGQHMAGQVPYQQANDTTVQFSNLTNSSSQPHQQVSENQAFQAAYHQFHNTMSPQFTSSIKITEAQSQQLSTQDTQRKQGHQPNNATASVLKRNQELHSASRRSTDEHKGQKSNPSGLTSQEPTQAQSQKVSNSKSKRCQGMQENLSAGCQGKDRGVTSSQSDKAREKCFSKITTEDLRSGKFSREEEEYCLAVINDFRLGLLDALPGQNICSYLAKKLGCTSLRISKKFHGIVSIPPFSPISIKGSDEKTEKEVANARKRTKALYKTFRSSESRKTKRIFSPDESLTLNADSQKRTSSNVTEERPTKNLKPRPLEVQAKDARAEREKTILPMKTNKGATENTHALAASQANHNLFDPRNQFQMSFNPLSSELQHSFLQQLHTNASNYRFQQVQNLELMQKALFCQVNAYTGMNGMALQPSMMVPSQGHELLKETVESAEKDIAAETLCAIRNTGKGNDE